MRKILTIEKGKKFGKWTVIETLPRKKNNQTYWLCECECGCVLEVKSNSLMNGNSTQCSNCAKKEVGLKKRKGYGEISGDMWAQIKKSAIRKKILFDVRVEEAWDLFIKQNRKCALSGLDLKFSGYPYDPIKTTAILDLINPELGYVSNNIQWIHKDIFLTKKSMSNAQYITLCSLVYNHNLCNRKNNLVEGIDYIIEFGKFVFTEAYHLKRGFCCKNNCKNCPYGRKTENSIQSTN